MKSLREWESKLFETINPAVKFSVTRYVFATGIFLAVVVFGLVSTFGLGVNLLPTLQIPVVAVVTSYPGASPSVMDLQVTQQIENAVATLAGITDINSNSSTGLSRVILNFASNTSQTSDANQVATQVAQVAARLPSGANTPVVRTFNPNARPILEFGIRGGGASMAQVYNYALNTLTPELERVSGVANVQLNGGPSRTFEVLLDPSKLAYYDVTPSQVVSAIDASSVDQSIGSVVTNGTTLSFSAQDQPSQLSQVSAVLVNPSSGLTVGQLGTVRDTNPVSTITRVNGQPVVLVSIQQTATSNEVAVAQAVRAFMSRIHLPAGYGVTYSNDTTKPISQAVNDTFRELLITALVVAFVVLVFLGRVNTAFAVILAIPIALSAVPVLFGLLGFTFNQVSLLAMIVAIGIVVDDSIVVAENVERYRAMGFARKEAVLRGASEVFGAVAAASLSLLSVLVPVSFIGGTIGHFFEEFALGLAAAVFFSWMEALLFLTVRMAYTPDAQPRTWRSLGRFLIRPGSLRWALRAWRSTWGLIVLVISALILVVVSLRAHHPIWILGILLYPLALAALHYLALALLGLLEALTNNLHAAVNGTLVWIREGYVRLLARVLPGSGWILVLSAALFVFTLVYLGPKLPFNFVPQSDNSNIQVNLRMPPGTPVDATNAVAVKIEHFLLSQKPVKTVQTTIGGNGIFSSGSNIAQMQVQLTPVGTRPSVFSLIPRYNAVVRGYVSAYPSANVFISAGGGFRGGGSSLSVSLSSPNLSILEQRNSAILQTIKNIPGVLSADSSLSNAQVENNFVANPTSLAGTGLTPSQVIADIATYVGGTQAGNVQIGGESYPIQVMADPTQLSSSQSLLTLPVYSPALKSNLQVGQLGSIVLQQVPSTISRYDQQYTASFSVNLVNPNTPALVFQKEVDSALQKSGLLAGGITIGSGSSFGAAALAGQLSSSGPIAFLLAVFLVYLVMGAQFNSFRYPLYLLLPVPLAIVGALWFVYAISGSLDVFGVLGMLLLIGLSAKNAILYLDFVVELQQVAPLREALLEAARLRFRPIVMTTLTVLVISFPLILSSGGGASFGSGIGVVMLGGILLSAILTFFVVPAAFYLFERRHSAPTGQLAVSAD
jgi:HAE1 family hydrophobic/amphiphilic exporter-1